MNKIEIKISEELIDYESSIQFMKAKVDRIKNNKSNELLWFLEHDDIYTQGTSAKNDEILKRNKIDIIQTNRGGKTTYHGPGQRIVYFLIDLNKRKKDIRSFISIIEKSLILFLADYEIEAQSFRDRVGIWVTKSKNKKFEREKKIGAIGLRVSKWVTYHGLSFNIKPNLEYYKYINPCGLKDYENTSLKELNVDITNDEFDNKFKKIFFKQLSKINIL